MYHTLSRGITARAVPWGRSFVIYAVVLMAAIALASPYAHAAKGGNGGGGSDCGKGNTTTVTGTVTNNYGISLVGADVTFTALTASCSTTTNGSGVYSIKVPSNASYDVSFAAANHKTYMVSGSVLKGKAATLNAVLTADARVIVTASVSNGAGPDGVVTATGDYTILDGSTNPSFAWTYTGDGVTPAISNPNSESTDVTLGTEAAYKDHLIQVLKDPPISAADLPPDLNLQPINQIQKGLQDRYQVVAIDPKAYEEAESVPLKFAVTTSSGTYSASVNAVTHLPWVVNPGVKTVPTNVPVLLYGKDAADYSWSIMSKPGTSTVTTLMDATSQAPWFTPDVVGTYEIMETESGTTLQVNVGRYHGVISPTLTLIALAGGDDRPVADPNCTGCHMVGGAAPDAFTPWRQTGHAEAFTQGITTNSHFGENCFACHAVGFDRDNAGGIDNSFHYDDFLADLSAAQHANPPAIAGLWESMLMNQPDTARLTNIQCDNCHGPSDFTGVHPSTDPADISQRVSLGAEVCGSCHGEPARHGRYQQWQLSNHADYDLARRFGDRSNCGRCHSGNGFIAWSKHNFNPDEDLSGTAPSVETVTWNDDTVVPQVCAACHNPHDTGTTSGSVDTNAKVRVNAGGIGGCDNPTCDTYELLAGFMADNVGKGATCMTCHNSRAEYPRNDTTWNQVVANGDTTDRPHHGVQADLIMGQNMYFTGVPVRGKHSLIEDTCVTCHMDKTLPPDILSYNQSGTNHTFAADPNICAECHGPTDPSADQIDAIVTGYMADLQTELGAAYLRMMEGHYPVDVGGDCGPADGATVSVTDVVWNERATRLNITMSNGNTCSNRDPAAILVDGGAQTLYTVSLDPADGNDGATLKAAWNWSMLNEDNTINECDLEEDPECEVRPLYTRRGVHNPDFSIKGLSNAIAAVQAIP